MHIIIHVCITIIINSSNSNSSSGGDNGDSADVSGGCGHLSGRGARARARVCVCVRARARVHMRFCSRKDNGGWMRKEGLYFSPERKLYVP